MCWLCSMRAQGMLLVLETDGIALKQVSDCPRTTEQDKLTAGRVAMSQIRAIKIRQSGIDL